MKKETEQLKSKIYKTQLLINRLESRVSSLENGLKNEKESVSSKLLNRIKGISCSRQV